MRPRLSVRKASLPYYKPYVIIDLDTNKIIGHYDSEKDAQQDISFLLDGIKSIDPSDIQNGNNPLRLCVSRLEHPFGDKPKPIVVSPGAAPKRKIKI